jgi:hypothetical protein
MTRELAADKNGKLRYALKHWDHVILDAALNLQIFRRNVFPD